jgi:hypothetical protein
VGVALEGRMKFVFWDRDGYDKTYEGWKYPPQTNPVEFSSLEEFVEWSVEVGLPRHTFVPPNGYARGKQNRTPYWLVFCEGGYD